MTVVACQAASNHANRIQNNNNFLHVIKCEAKNILSRPQGYIIVCVQLWLREEILVLIGRQIIIT